MSKTFFPQEIFIHRGQVLAKVVSKDRSISRECESVVVIACPGYKINLIRKVIMGTFMKIWPRGCNGALAAVLF